MTRRDVHLAFLGEHHWAWIFGARLQARVEHDRESGSSAARDPDDVAGLQLLEGGGRGLFVRGRGRHLERVGSGSRGGVQRSLGVHSA